MTLTSELLSMARDDIAAITASLERARQDGDYMGVQFWTAALEDVRGLEEGLDADELDELNNLHDAWVPTTDVHA